MEAFGSCDAGRSRELAVALTQKSANGKGGHGSSGAMFELERAADFRGAKAQGETQAWMLSRNGQHLLLPREQDSTPRSIAAL
jgi:hypothetical protein